MKITVNGKEVEITQEVMVQKIIQFRSAWDLVAGKLYSDEKLFNSMNKYTEDLFKMEQGWIDKDQKAVQEGMNHFVTIGRFLESEWSEGKTVNWIIHNSPDIRAEMLQRLDDQYNNVRGFLGLDDVKDMPAKNEELLHGVKAPKAFIDAANEPNLVANYSDDGEYPYDYYLADALKRGFKEGDLGFLKSVYECVAELHTPFPFKYIRSIFSNEEMDREKLIDFAADFTRRNHINGEKYVNNEKNIVKFFNDTFKDDRPEIPEPPAYDSSKPIDWQNAPAKATELLRALDHQIGFGQNQLKLDEKDFFESYRTITGEKDDELNKLKDMFNTGKGFFGGGDTDEYTKAKNALDSYIKNRNRLRTELQKIVKDVYNDQGSFNDRAKEAIPIMNYVDRLRKSRKLCEDLMKAYISKKTNGTIEPGKNGKKEYTLGDKGIEDRRQGAESARLSSALLILDVLREERGGTKKSDHMQKKQEDMKVKAVTFAQLYEKEKKAKGASRKKTSDKVLESIKNKKNKETKAKNKAKNKAVKV